jgi:hypothetical protein
VGIIPFVVNALTLNVNPIKLREYLAAGLPVVSTRLPEIEPYGEVVHLAANEGEFIEGIEKALRETGRIGWRGGRMRFRGKPGRRGWKRFRGWWRMSTAGEEIDREPVCEIKRKDCQVRRADRYGTEDEKAEDSENKRRRDLGGGDSGMRGGGSYMGGTQVPPLAAFVFTRREDEGGRAARAGHRYYAHAGRSL